MKNQFKLFSWNIDELDEYAIEIRTQGVIDIIKKQEPDAIFLQEVIPKSLELIRNSLPEYQSYAGKIKQIKFCLNYFFSRKYSRLFCGYLNTS